MIETTAGKFVLRHAVARRRYSDAVPQTIDPEWARERLEWWVERTTSGRSTSASGGLVSWVSAGPVLTDLRRNEHQIQSILRVILSRNSVSTLLSPFGTQGHVHVNAGVELVQYAIGVLETSADTRAHIRGTEAPTMSADALHEDVWRAASKLWGDGHFSEAVQRAATFLNADVQARVSRSDVSDQPLMAQAFSLAAPEPGKPRLRWPGEDTNLTVKAMRTGLLNFSQGVFAAIRNPATHSTEELPKQIALEQLATLSTLARWIDRCELITA